jgi:hypothetical protein
VFTPEDENTSFSATVRVNTDTYQGSDWEYEFDVPVIFKEKYIESDLSDTDCWKNDFGLVIGNSLIGADGNLAIKTALRPIWKNICDNGGYNYNFKFKLTNIHCGNEKINDVVTEFETPDEIIKINLPTNTSGVNKS